MRSLIAVSLSISVALLAGCASSQTSTTEATPKPASEPTAALQPIPEGFTAGPVPHLVVAGAQEAIAFYEKALGAKKIEVFAGDDGRVMHAMLQLGDSVFSVSDEYPEMGSVGPKTLGGTPATLYVYTDDVDSAFAGALAAGGVEKEAPSYMFWGDRVGTLMDPFGHRWSLSTHMVSVPPEQMNELAQQAMGGSMPEQPADAKALPKPEGWTTLTVILAVDDVDAAISYYQKALGAKVNDKMAGPEGTVHAELTIRDQILMVGVAHEDYKSAQTLGGSPITLQYYVSDPDSAHTVAVEHGAKSLMAPTDMFWGDRWGEFTDPTGIRWGVASHVEDVAPEEMKKRMLDSMQKPEAAPQG